MKENLFQSLKVCPQKNPGVVCPGVFEGLQYTI
jgi:hypothetical protein